MSRTVESSPTGAVTLGGLTARTMVVHSVTYLVVGIVALNLFDYGARFGEGGLSFLRKTDDPLVMAGPLFQPIRGILFGIAFYLLRDSWLGKKNGWLVLWLTLVLIGILSTFGPSLGSVEGMVYTTAPLDLQLLGLSEVLLQALLLASITAYWVAHREKRWLSWTLGVAFGLSLVLPTLGLLFGG